MQRLSSSDGPAAAQSARLAAAREQLARIEADLAQRSDGPEQQPGDSHPQPGNPRPQPENPAEPHVSRGARKARAQGRGGVPPEDDPARAYDACLRLLGERARSRGELAERLARREYSPPTIETVLARLDREGLIDDADFADQWVHFRHRDGGKAKRALAMELRQKGVADEVAATALEQISGDDEAQRAAELVRRKLARKTVDPGMDRAQRDKEIRRLVGMLARKGYAPGLAFSVVKAEWAKAERPEGEARED